MKVLLNRRGGLFVCGTNAFNPLCANYTVSRGRSQQGAEPETRRRNTHTHTQSETVVWLVVSSQTLQDESVHVSFLRWKHDVCFDAAVF